MTSVPGFSGHILTRPVDGWPEEVSGAAGPFRLDPELVAVPTCPADVAALVQWASAEGAALTARGGGTGMPGGNVTRRVLVDLRTHFRTIHSVDPVRRLITVDPGVTIAEVERAAAAHGLTFHVRPSSADRCVVGGLVANNAGAPATLKYGSARRWVREVDVVMADGRRVRLSRTMSNDDPFASAGSEWMGLVNGWPRVRKNSSGYALDALEQSGCGLDLFVGSEGTLGLATEVTLALDQAPQSRATAIVAAGDLDELADLTAVARAQGAAACEFLGKRLIELAALDVDPELGAIARGAVALLLVEFDGDTAAVERGTAELTRAAAASGAMARTTVSPAQAERYWSLRRRASPAIRAAAASGRRSLQFIEDSVVPPERLSAYVTGVSAILERYGTDAAIFGHAGDANVHVNPLVDVRGADWLDRVRSILEETVSLVAELGGTLSGEHGDGRVRAPYLERIWGKERATAFVGIKRRLDPNDVLNPGVVVPVAEQDPLQGLDGIERSAF